MYNYVKLTAAAAAHGVVWQSYQKERKERQSIKRRTLKKCCTCVCDVSQRSNQKNEKIKSKGVACYGL